MNLNVFLQFMMLISPPPQKKKLLDVNNHFIFPISNWHNKLLTSKSILLPIHSHTLCAVLLVDLPKEDPEVTMMAKHQTMKENIYGPQVIPEVNNIKTPVQYRNSTV